MEQRIDANLIFRGSAKRAEHAFHAGVSLVVNGAH